MWWCIGKTGRITRRRSVARRGSGESRCATARATGHAVHAICVADVERRIRFDGRSQSGDGECRDRSRHRTSRRRDELRRLRERVSCALFARARDCSFLRARVEQLRTRRMRGREETRLRSPRAHQRIVRHMRERRAARCERAPQLALTFFCAKTLQKPRIRNSGSVNSGDDEASNVTVHARASSRRQ